MRYQRAIAVLVFLAGPAFCQVQDAGSSQLRKTWELGRSAALEIEKRDGVLDDAATIDYVRGIANRISAASGTKAPEIRLTRSSDEYATLLPHGVLYISGGLLERIENEAALASLLAHQAAHVQRGEKVTVTSSGVQLHHPLCVLASGFTPMSMHDEEHDVMAMTSSFTAKAGFDPLPGLELFSKLAYEHPSWAKAFPAEDLLNLRAAVESQDPPIGGYVVDTSNFKNHHAAIVVALGHAQAPRPPSLNSSR